MEPYADVGCVLKVNVHCDACKMKMMEILSSISGVYSVTIDAEEGVARVIGEVDPNMLLRAMARSGRHAEIVWVKLKHPLISRGSSSYHDNNNSSYNSNYGYNNNPYNHSSYNNNYGYPSYGYNNPGAVEDPYMYRSRGLPQQPWYGGAPQYHPMRRMSPDYPYYGNYRHSMPPPARNRSYYH